MKKICIVGLGNMGQPLFEMLKVKFEVSTCTREDDINKKLENCEAFIIAVKPQNFGELAANIRIDLSEKMAISIMAGISIAKLQELLKMKKVVRTLPNLPVKVGEALTIWKASEEFCDREFLQDLLWCVGDEIELKDEEDIEKIGAICGCGPAYFAYLGEKMAKLSLEFGLSEKDANKIAKQNLIGTSELVKDSGWSLTELRERVTSKGGVTAAAIKSFEENGFEEVFNKGIEAAIKRTKELNG